MLSNELLLPCCECVINNNYLSWNSPISGNGLPGNELFSNFEVANFGNYPQNRNSNLASQVTFPEIGNVPTKWTAFKCQMFPGNECYFSSREISWSYDRMRMEKLGAANWDVEIITNVWTRMSSFLASSFSFHSSLLLEQSRKMEYHLPGEHSLELEYLLNSRLELPETGIPALYPLPS